MLLLNPIIAMLHNVADNRWHPILFVESPLPGPNPTIVRHKSKGHHTEGFASRDEANTNAKEELALKVDGARLELDVVFEWDGQGIPAMVHFFGGRA